MNQIVIPTRLQRKVVQAAHHMGHLGMTKTKQMLREKYWFPTMNSMVEQIVGQCFECQVTTKKYQQEPVKPTAIPEKPWDVIALDFGGPYPDGHYNLVAIDKRTRYPEVEQVSSTTCSQTKEKLKVMFATHGTPREVESDNGPPFQSKEFADFAETEGFHHHRVTPGHARANGEAESFMKLLNKTEKIAHLQGQDSSNAIQEMLTGFRSTPHPATGATPYEAMMNRSVRTKLDHQNRATNSPNGEDIAINRKDEEYKDKMVRNSHKRNTREHNFTVGDHVLLKQKANKWSTAYETAFYTVTRVDGSSIAAKRIKDGREVYRDASQYKLVNSLVLGKEHEEFVEHEEIIQDDERENLMRNTEEETRQTTTGSTTNMVETNQESIQDIEPNVQARETRNTTEIDVAQVGKQQPKLRPRRNRRRPAYLSDYVTY